MKQTIKRDDPADLQIEQSLLGSCLVDNRAIDLCAGTLDARDFFEPLHQTIFEMICALAGEGSVDPIILGSVLKTDTRLQDVGGVAYLITLVQAAPARPNIEQLCARLIDLSERRDLIGIAEEMTADAYDAPASTKAREISERATESLLSIGLATSKPIIAPYDLAMSSLKRIEATVRGDPIPMVKTGWGKIDDEIGGLRGGDFALVPALSGMGKTSLLCGMALNAARQGYPTIFFSLEMTSVQTIERMVCDLAYEACMDDGGRALWYSRVRNGHLNPGDFERFAIAARALQDLPLEIHDDDTLTVQQIGVRARAFKAKHGNAPLGLVAVDYAQIVQPLDDRAPREQQVAATARGLKATAKRTGWPVVAGSQMNENAGARPKDEKRPQLSDIRESKALGNEADIALSPFRPAYFVENRKPMEAVPGDAEWTRWRAELSAVQHRMDVLCIKNRHGRRFDAELYCEMGANAIRDAAPRQALSQKDRDLLDMAGA